MRVDVTPRTAEIVPGQPLFLTVMITNTSTVIGGYVVRLLGADPGWVEYDGGQVSLFPDEVRVLTVTITPPKGIPAGVRRIAVQVRELTPPQDSAITDIDLTVPAAKSLQSIYGSQPKNQRKRSFRWRDRIRRCRFIAHTRLCKYASIADRKFDV